MRTAPIAMFLAVLGCGPSPDPIGGTEVVVATQEEGRIDRVEPSFGTNGGGEFVTLAGGPFPTNPVVRFGGAEATVLAATRDQIQVQTPRTDKTGWVPVKVTGPDGAEIRLKRAYQFWEDGNGLTGLWGELYRLDFLGAYWTPPGTQVGPYTPPPQAQARLVFLNPADIAYQDVWSPYWDWCEIDYNPVLQATSIDTGMEALTLTGDGGESIRLLPSTETINYFDRFDVEPLLFSPGVVYALQSGASTGAWPAFGVDDLVTIPDRPEILSPALDDVAPPPITGDLDLQWQVSPTSSYMTLIVSRTTSGGAQTAERATCLLNDDGQHTVPASLWSAWEPGEFLMIQLGRVSLTDRTLPHNRSQSQLVGVYWTLGAMQMM